MVSSFALKNKARVVMRKLLFAVSPTYRMLVGNRQRMKVLLKKIEKLEEKKESRVPLESVIETMRQMAVTGENTDQCLEKGFLPVPVHFYQPIPDIKDLERRKIWDKVSKLDGIKFEPEKYRKFIQMLGEKYGKECDWPNEPTGNPSDFFLNNNCFSYGCAAALHSIIRDAKPKRIIEVGSGNSSKIIRDAIALNEKKNGVTAEYTIIDPFCEMEGFNFSENTHIVKKKVEEVEMSFFEQLEENDILFIDSSHVSKIGGDVNFEILEVLPILKKGVIIHFHDIELPFEYSKVYATNPQFRMFWTEAYLLQSFLMFNDHFEIMLPMAYTQRKFEKEFRESFPNSSKAKNFGSGSFWLRKKK